MPSQEEGRAQRDTQGEGYMKTEAGIAVMQPWAKESWGHQMLERKDPPLEPWEEAGPCFRHLDFKLLPPECWGNKFPLLYGPPHTHTVCGMFLWHPRTPIHSPYSQRTFSDCVCSSASTALASSIHSPPRLHFTRSGLQAPSLFVLLRKKSSGTHQVTLCCAAQRPHRTFCNDTT